MKNERLFFHRGQLTRFLSYSLLSVALFLPTATTWAETHTTTLTQTTGKLRGRIVDAKTGEAIIGASIQVKGKKQVGTASDVQGGYTLSASPGDLLVITCIGYQTLEVRATAGEQIIQLKEDAKMLVELVVVGYTTQRKESLTGASRTASSRISPLPPLVICSMAKPLACMFHLALDNQAQMQLWSSVGKQPSMGIHAPSGSSMV